MLTAQEFRSQRQKHKQSQADLAKSLGVEEKVIAGYESGTAPVPAEHEEKLIKLWHTPPAVAKPAPTKAAPTKEVLAKSAPVKPVPTPAAPTKAAPVQTPAAQPPAVKATPIVAAAPTKQEPKPAKKAETEKMPSVTQWLQDIAQDRSERPARPVMSVTSTGHGASSSAATAPSNVPADSIIQAASQLTTDKLRRLALDSLLTAAEAQITTVFTEDKQINVTAEAIEKLLPAHRQVIMNLIEQLEQIKAPTKGKLSAQEQILQTLKGQTPYETALNYLNAAIQLLKQADASDRAPLVSRLQGLSDFDRGTISMMTKRYQEARRPNPNPDNKPS